MFLRAPVLEVNIPFIFSIDVDWFAFSAFLLKALYMLLFRKLKSFKPQTKPTSYEGTHKKQTKKKTPQRFTLVKNNKGKKNQKVQ